MAEDAGEKKSDGAFGERRPAVLVGALTMTSRVLGLVRDILFATLFFGRALDAFALAFTVPNLFRRLFGEGALAGVLVPAFVKKIEREKPEAKGLAQAGRLAAKALGALAVFLGGIALAVVVVSALVALVAGTKSKVGLVAGVLAVVMPYVVLICGAAVLMAYLNASGRFGAPAAAPVILNVTLIAAALITRSVWGLAVGVIVGGAGQFLIQYIPARRLGLPALPKLDGSDPDLRAVGRRLVPVVAGLAAFQVNVLLDRLIAECLIPGDGAVGSLFLGSRLMQLPLAVFAIAVATVTLPALSSCAAKRDEEGFQSVLRDAVSSILFWTIPAAVGLALLAQPIVALLFDRGAFLESRGALTKTSLVVIFYAPGLVAFGVAGLLARAHYARGEPGRVMRAALWSVGVNLVLNLVLVFVFRHIELRPCVAESAASPEAGLALASTASGFVYLALLSAGLSVGLKGGPKGTQAAERAALLPVLLNCAAAMVVGLLVTVVAFHLPEAGGRALKAAWDWMWRVPRLPTAVCFGAFAALAVVIGFGLRPALSSFLRTSATAAGMGVFVNLVLSSLPPEGDHWMIPFQRALAPVVLGAVAYWFLAGFAAAPEYEKARGALVSAVFRGRGGKDEDGAG